MGTFIKYVFYLIVLMVVYLIGRGIYEGSITQETTVGNVAEQVDSGSRELAKEAGQGIKKGYEGVKRDLSQKTEN